MESLVLLKSKQKKWPIYLLAIIALLLVVLIRFGSPSKNFPTPYLLIVDEGQTLFSISNELYKEGAIKNKRVFEFWMLMLGNDRNISVGEYYFSKPVGALQVALRISGKQFGIEKKKVTFPEGFTVVDMATRLKATLPNFDEALFLQLATPHEGYLFPDTYSFFPTVTPDVVLTALRKNYATRTEDLKSSITASGKTENEIITMASIVEREANGKDDRAVIAGILWERIRIGKPLQVDAPFAVLLQKESAELTRKDLSLDSPYNTYTHKGLPPGPIANPGLAAIEATLHPVASPYLYYLHDKEGNIYYARTYSEHLKNVSLYLKNRK